MTDSDNIPLYDPSPNIKSLNSTYDFYSSEHMSVDAPYSFSLVPFYPELDYFFDQFAGVQNTFTFQQWRMLFDDSSEGNVQTFMNPINLHNFYEHYKNGDFDAIRKHFSYDYDNAPISDD